MLNTGCNIWVLCSTDHAKGLSHGGVTLKLLGAKSGFSVEELIRFNALWSPQSIFAGQYPVASQRIEYFVVQCNRHLINRNDDIDIVKNKIINHHFEKLLVNLSFIVTVIQIYQHILRTKNAMWATNPKFRVIAPHGPAVPPLFVCDQTCLTCRWLASWWLLCIWRKAGWCRVYSN